MLQNAYLNAEIGTDDPGWLAAALGEFSQKERFRTHIFATVHTSICVQKKTIAFTRSKTRILALLSY